MNSITLWFKVRKLQKLSDSIYKDFKKAEMKAKEEHENREYIQALIHEYWSENQLYDDEIMDLNTRYLYLKAQNLLLPVPDYNDETIWEVSNITGRRNLTNKGVTELRSSIRKELHERRVGYLTWLAALTGIIGALTGLAAVFDKNL